MRFVGHLGLFVLFMQEGQIVVFSDVSPSRGYPEAGMSFGDSKAVFKQRAMAMGLGMEEDGINIMATFAFAYNYAPGASSDAPLVEIIKKIIGRDPTTLEMSVARRLFNESYAHVAPDIKTQVEQTDETATRRLAPAERADRLRIQQTKLSGIAIRGQYEPGDALVDKCCACYESDRLVYIEWSSCISREFELSSNVKKDNSLSFSSDGTLKLSKGVKTEPCQAASEIQVRYCLVRRGLALDQANILDYHRHDKWLEVLLGARLEDPPPGYSRVSMKQLELADKKLFTLMAEETRSGIKATTAGRPCDDAFDRKWETAEVRHLLHPKLAPSEKFEKSGFSDVESPVKKFKRDKKGKGKGSGSSDQFMRVPVELLKLGSVGATSKGHRLCFGFNLKTCKETVAKQRCPRGLHPCSVKDCHRQHPALECPKAKKE